MSIRSPRSPSRRSGSISISSHPYPFFPMVDSSPPPMPAARRPDISLPMPLPPVPVAYPDLSIAGPSRPTFPAHTAPISPHAPAEQVRGVGPGMGEDEARARRRMRRRSKRNLGESSDGGKVRMSASMPREEERKGGMDAQEVSDSGSEEAVQRAGAGDAYALHHMNSLQDSRSPVRNRYAIPSPMQNYAALPCPSSTSASDCYTPRSALRAPHTSLYADCHADTPSGHTNCTTLDSTLPINTPTVTIHPSPSSPRISALLLDTPPLPPRSPTPVPGSKPGSSARARRISGVRMSIPPATPDPPAFAFTALSPASLPPLPVTPNFAVPRQYGEELMTPQVAGCESSAARSNGSRSAYDVTTPRRYPAQPAQTPSMTTHAEVQQSVGSSHRAASRIAYDVTSPRPTRIREAAAGTPAGCISTSYSTPKASLVDRPGQHQQQPVHIDFGARQDSSSFTNAYPVRAIWEPDRSSLETDARLLPPIPLTAERAYVSQDVFDPSSPVIRLQPDVPRSISMPASASVSVSTPTPPRPARRRYDGKGPLAGGTPQAPSQKQMQPSPLVLPSPMAPVPHVQSEVAKLQADGTAEEEQAQRRLEELKGLVQTIDFGQPWGSAGTIVEDADPRPGSASSYEPIGAGVMDYSCEPAVPNTSNGQATISPFTDSASSFDHVDREPIRVTLGQERWSSRERPKVGSKVKLAPTSPDRPLAAVSQDHGWPSPVTTPIRAVRDTPPRPRQRSEVFDVASAGYNSSAPATPLARPRADCTSRRRDDDGRVAFTPTPTTWRGTLSNDLIYTRLYAVDPAKVTRQEVMWEMCETEQVFLRSIRTVLRLFAIPVKTPQGNWIDGIPPPISELFDNLESIAHAHSVLCTSQRDMRRRAEVLDFDAFIAVLKNWTPRLAPAYEWYLCKFEAVVAMVEDHVRDPDSVFGEFVRMQLQDEALGSMSLGSMLLKPVQRLMKYPLFLKRLQEVNPRHPELLSLIGITESIIHSLQATKAKEDEYRQLKMLESRLSFPVDMDLSARSSHTSDTGAGGKGHGFRLANRNRKLLGMSTVLRLTPAQMSMPVRSSIASSTSSATTSCYFSQNPHQNQNQTPSRQSSFSASSVSSGPSRSGSLRMSMSMSMGISLPMSPGRDKLYRTPSMISMNGNGNGNGEYPTSPGRSRSKRCKDELTLFVFDDLVILAQSHEKGGLFTSKTKKERGWRVLPEAEGGLGRVVGVREWEGPIPCFLLTILPLNPSLPSVSVCLSVPIPREPASPLSASTSSNRRAGNGLLPDVKTFSTMQTLMQALQDTQTVESEDPHCAMGMDGKEELMSLMSGHGGGGALRGRGMHETQNQGEVVYTSEGFGDDHPLFSLRAMGY